MAKDYAKKYIKYKYLTPRRKNNRYLWVMLGISVGLFILGALFLSPTHKGKSIQLAEKKIHKENAKSPAPPLPEPEFDFYNILPQENLNLSPHAAMKKIPLTDPMSTAIPASSGHQSIDEMLSPTPEQVAIAEAKRQLGEEMSQFNSEGYMLLLGNFTNRAQAEQLQAQALLKGFPVKKKVSLIDGKSIYQVFLGPADLNKLTEENQRLNEAGLTAILTKITP